MAWFLILIILPSVFRSVWNTLVLCHYFTALLLIILVFSKLNFVKNSENRRIQTVHRNLAALLLSAIRMTNRVIELNRRHDLFTTRWCRLAVGRVGIGQYSPSSVVTDRILVLYTAVRPCGQLRLSEQRSETNKVRI